MSANSKIEWTETTWNPVVGCTRVSEGCRNCYAERMSGRLANMPSDHNYKKVTKRVQRNGKTVYLGQWNHKVAMVTKRFDEPRSWRTPRKVFVCSMSDLFQPRLYTDRDDEQFDADMVRSQPLEMLENIWFTMLQTPQHTYQVLTKRPQIMAHLVPRVMRRLNLSDPLPNVWLGTSVEHQPAVNERLSHLLQCPAAVRFLSVEPLLGAIDLFAAFARSIRWNDDVWDQVDQVTDQWQCELNRYRAAMSGKFTMRDRLAWVIAGGESGPGARPMHPQWARNLRDQCVGAEVPFFFKQWGAYRPCDWDGMGVCPLCGAEHGRWIPGELPTEPMLRVGKTKAGRMLDGRTWDQFPISNAAKQDRQ